MQESQQTFFQTGGNILGYFLSAVVFIRGFILIGKRHHIQVGVPNVLAGLRLKLIRRELTTGFSE